MKALALWVEDAKQAHKETTSRGAKALGEPLVLTDKNGEVVMTTIQTYGDTIHRFVERKITKVLFCQVMSLGIQQVMQMLKSV